MNIVETNTIERSAQRQATICAGISRTSAQRRPVTFCNGEPTVFAQRGMALVVSLVLLASMTIIGVATLSGTRLNEQMASNAQQKSIVFEAAESAIETVANYNELFAAITSNPNASSNNPDQVQLSNDRTSLEDGYDLLTDGKGINIDGTLTVQYCGETQPIGTSLSAALDSGSLTAVLVDINSVASIGNSSASADHLRRVSFTMPQTGRAGNCTARY